MTPSSSARRDESGVLLGWASAWEAPLPASDLVAGLRVVTLVAQALTVRDAVNAAFGPSESACLGDVDDVIGNPRFAPPRCYGQHTASSAKIAL